MLKTIALYSFVLSLMLLLLNSIDYLFWMRYYFIEIYIGLIAITFLALGIWFGSKKQQNPQITVLESPENLDFSKLGISKREFEVLKLVGKGLSNQEIADELFVSNNTIKTHTSKIFEKLEVKNRTQAILKAKQIGLVI